MDIGFKNTQSESIHIHIRTHNGKQHLKKGIIKCKKQIQNYAS